MLMEEAGNLLITYNIKNLSNIKFARLGKVKFQIYAQQILKVKCVYKLLQDLLFTTVGTYNQLTSILRV